MADQFKMFRNNSNKINLNEDLIADIKQAAEENAVKKNNYLFYHPKTIMIAAAILTSFIIFSDNKIDENISEVLIFNELYADLESLEESLEPLLIEDNKHNLNYLDDEIDIILESL